MQFLLFTLRGDQMGRTPCCDKSKVKRGPWSPEEDAVLRGYIHKHGSAANWIALPHKAGLKRCGKSCRLRWLNYLRPDIKHGAFSPEEDDIICSLYTKLGSRWSIIASQLPGRTDNDVKNHWNTRLKKKLQQQASANTSCSSNNHSNASAVANKTTIVIDDHSSLIDTIMRLPHHHQQPFSSPPASSVVMAGYDHHPQFQCQFSPLSQQEDGSGSSVSGSSSSVSVPAAMEDINCCSNEVLASSAALLDDLLMPGGIWSEEVLPLLQTTATTSSPYYSL